MGHSLTTQISGYLLYLVIRISAVLSKYIPRPWRYLIGTVVGDAVYMIWGSKRRVIQENAAAVLGLDRRDIRVKQLARKSIRNYCKYLIEFLELPVLSLDDPAITSWKLSGTEHLQAAVDAGKGTILASGHFGSIEWPGLRVLDFTRNFHAVYDEFTPPCLDRLIREHRKEKGINPIPASNVRAMLKALKSGGAIAVLFDKPVDIDKGVPVRFFGRETAVPGGLALLAMKTGAAILPAYSFRHPDLSFRSDVYPPITWTQTGDRDRDMQVIMQKLMDTLQQAIRQQPDQWYMFRPMWPDVPEVVTSGTREATAGESQV